MKKLFLFLMLLLPVTTVWGNVISQANIGDTLACFMVNKDGNVHFEDCIQKGMPIQVVPNGENAKHAIHFLRIDDKNDSILKCTIFQKEPYIHVASGMYHIMIDGKVYKHGIWTWYDANEKPIYQEIFDNGELQSKELFYYDRKGQLLVRRFYRYIKEEKKLDGTPIYTLNLKQFDIINPSGRIKTTVTQPRNRVKRNSRGVPDVQLTESVYYDEEGNVVKLENEQKVKKSVQKYIQKNHKCPALSAVRADFSFDVMVKIDQEGNIRFIDTDTQCTYLDIVTQDEISAQNEWRIKVFPELKKYLENELLAQQMKCSPITVGKSSVEVILYFTVTIRI